MVEQLFGSKTRVKLLNLFFKNPSRSFYVREITRTIDEQINSVRRELANLLSIGIITSDNVDNKLYYAVNTKYEHYAALDDMFGEDKKAKAKVKSAGDKSKSRSKAEKTQTNDPMLDILQKAGNLRLAVITGQFTLDEQSGTDIVLVGDINESNLEHAIKELEDLEKKELRYAVFEPEEFVYRKQINDRFISDVFLSRKVVLIDKDNLA